MKAVMKNTSGTTKKHKNGKKRGSKPKSEKPKIFIIDCTRLTDAEMDDVLEAVQDGMYYSCQTLMFNWEKTSPETFQAWRTDDFLRKHPI